MIPADEADHRAWLASLADVGGARLVVDLGCGKGGDLARLAERATPDARLVGIDSWPAQLQAARALCAVDQRISFVELDLESGRLPFDDGAVDVVYSNNVLECLADPRLLPHEIARVLRPGGQVLCAHWDWDSQTFDVDDKDLARRIIHAFADLRQDWMRHADGWMGRRLWRVFQHCGRFEGRVVARTLTNTVYEHPWYGHKRVADFADLVKRGVVSPAEYGRFLEQVESAAREDRYFYSVTCYAFVGRALPG